MRLTFEQNSQNLLIIKSKISVGMIKLKFYFFKVYSLPGGINKKYESFNSKIFWIYHWSDENQKKTGRSSWGEWQLKWYLKEIDILKNVERNQIERNIKK